MTLSEAARRYLESAPAGERVANQAEVERFVRWCGGDRACSLLRGQEVANYGETLHGNVTDVTERGEAVRAFLAFAKKAGFTKTNMGTHLRLKKTTTSRQHARKGAGHREVEMSAGEKDAFEAELASLKAQRPQIVADIQRAMADKDFRENAPLDAAKDRQGHVEGRIRQLQATLDHALVVEDGPASGEVIEIGSTVVVHNMKSESQVTYTLVRPGEANAAQGRISFESPVGQALLYHRAGEEVEVAAPSGTVRLRIERVEA